MFLIYSHIMHVEPMYLFKNENLHLFQDVTYMS